VIAVRKMKVFVLFVAIAAAAWQCQGAAWRQLPNFPTPNEIWARWPLHSGDLMPKLDTRCGST